MRIPPTLLKCSTDNYTSILQRIQRIQANTNELFYQETLTFTMKIPMILTSGVVMTFSMFLICVSMYIQQHNIRPHSGCNHLRTLGRTLRIQYVIWANLEQLLHSGSSGHSEAHYGMKKSTKPPSERI